MAQQRIKCIRQTDNTIQTTVETDTNTLTAQPVALDANETARIIIPDTIPLNDLQLNLQAVIHAIEDGQVFLAAEVG